MKYAKYLKPVAITITRFNKIKSVGLIKLCYIIKSPERRSEYWLTKIIKRIFIDENSNYELLCNALMKKYDIPYIANVVRNRDVTTSQRQIISTYKTFVCKKLGVKNNAKKTN